MSARTTVTTVTVRASDVQRGEIVQIGGLVFTRLVKDGPLSKSSIRQKLRFVKVMAVSYHYEKPTAADVAADVLPVSWVEFMFRGGDSPATERVMFALYRPYESVRVQVEKEG